MAAPLHALLPIYLIMIKPCMQRFNEALTCEHVNVRDYDPRAGHSGSIAHSKTSLLMWHIVNEERGVWSMSTCMLVFTMKVVTKTSVI